LRLCYIANPNSIHVHRWINYFIRRGDEVYLIGDKPLRRSIPQGVTFYDLTKNINLRKVRYLAWILFVRKIVREVKLDVLHAHSVASAGWLGATADYHPFLVTAHGSDLLLLSQRSQLHRQFSLWALQRADFVTCVSKELAEKARSLGVPSDNLEVIYLGVETDTFYPERNAEQLRYRLHMAEGPIVLSIRAIKSIYNPLIIAKSIPVILKRVPTAQFVIFTYNAKPALLSQFKSIVQASNATKAVRYIGPLPNDEAIAEFYRAADVAVSVPSSDGTPKSVQEAMACGTPAVLSDLPSLHEWVRHEQEGLFVPAGDVKATSEAIIRLLKDEELRKRLGKSCVRVIHQRADSNVWMRRSEEIYHSLVRSSKRTESH
jgi:L-malate glycosyltransferase